MTAAIHVRKTKQNRNYIQSNIVINNTCILIEQFLNNLKSKFGFKCAGCSSLYLHKKGKTLENMIHICLDVYKRQIHGRETWAVADGG